jgi:murein DD-endopeptidase MepM/ murein hydrolase activator NlpD
MWIMPLPEGTYRIGSRFGLRVAPIGVRKVENHNGLDFRAPSGTPVLAVDTGTVTERNDDPQAAAGLYVKVQHADGSVASFCHLSEISVPFAAKVRQGEQIGRVGSTGKSTGPHLHFVARVGGKVVDPLSVLPAV